MLIFDLDYLEVVRKENRVEGGTISVVGATANAGAIGTTQAFITNITSTSNSIIESSSPLFPGIASSLSVAIAAAFAR